MKVATVILFLLMAASAARADTIVQVDLLPATFGPLYSPSAGLAMQSIGVEFTWDVTTNVLSDFEFDLAGPWAQEMLPSRAIMDSTGISLLNFYNPATGDFFQFDRFIHSIYSPILSTPGTYRTPDLYFRCGSCLAAVDSFRGTEYTVSTVVTPEPGTLPLLVIALAFLLRLYYHPTRRRLA